MNQDTKSNNPFPSYVQTEALHHLCKMNPDYSMTIRSEAIQKCCLPELTVKLTLDCRLGSDERRDLVEFLSGLLLGSDIHVRKWFAHFIKSGQKVCFFFYNFYQTVAIDPLHMTSQRR